MVGIAITPAQSKTLRKLLKKYETEINGNFAVFSEPDAIELTFAMNDTLQTIRVMHDGTIFHAVADAA